MSTGTGDFWTVRQAAEVLEVNYKTLYKELKVNNGRVGGVLIAFRLSTTWKCIPAAIERLKRGESADQNS